MTTDANDVARAHGIGGLRLAFDRALVEAQPAQPGEEAEARPPAFTEEVLALRFAALHANDLRFVAPWSKWLHWTGTHWRVDETLFAFDMARAVCREAAAQCSKERTAETLASAKTVAAVERLAKADRQLAATLDQWDANPDIFNTKGPT